MSALGSRKNPKSRMKYLLNCLDCAFELARDGASIKLYDKAGVRHIYERSGDKLHTYGSWGAQLAIVRNARNALKVLLHHGGLS